MAEPPKAGAAKDSKDAPPRLTISLRRTGEAQNSGTGNFFEAEDPEEVARREEEQKRLEEEQKRKEEEQKRKEEEEQKRLEDEQRRLEEEERKRAEAARLRMITEATQEEISGLNQENMELQKRICTMQKKRRSVNAEQFILEGQEAYYRARLRNWTETKNGFKRVKEEYDRKIDNLRDRLQQKQNEANARQEGMIHYMWKLEQEERDAVVEKQTVRIRGRQLKSQLAKLELKLELKDQLLSENGSLHLVDYEQLKMENESLNAKIQLKNEALLTLRKKAQFLVHLLTHVREKLQFLFVECKEKGELLASDDKTLHGSRIRLSKLKSSVMAIRRKKDALQKNFVSVTSSKMLDDMDYQREDIEAEEKIVRDLKKRYTDLNDQIEERKRKLFALRGSSVPITKSANDSLFERGALRWGMRRGVLGQMVVEDMVEMMAEQMATKPPVYSPS